MRKVEIAEITPMSAFKATIYILIIPFALMMLIGLFMVMIGIMTDQSAILFAGLVYVVMPIILIGIYGVICMLIALVYNLLARKFGGIELIVKDKY